MSDDDIIHFNPWRDFNDAAPIDDPFGVDPDAGQIAAFLDVVFGYCDGLIPVRGFVDKGQGTGGRPHNIWIDADDSAPDKLATFAAWARREGAAVYVIPGTVAEHGQARSADILRMQTVVVDLDMGDIDAKLDHLVLHLGRPALVVESGGRTAEGKDKVHAWWKLTEPAEGEDLARLCRLRGEIAVKVGGDTHFRSAHQPIRVPGSVYHKGGFQRLVQIREANAVEIELDDLAALVAEMPPIGGASLSPLTTPPTPEKPSLDAVLTTPVREGGADAWTRFAGASAAIGHFLRLVHEGRMTPDEGWEAICGYNAAMLRPSWPEERLKAESERLWALHVEKHGPPLIRAEGASRPAALPAFTLGQLLDDASPMPEDIIAPRVLTPGGLLVLGGAPKVGKSDFLMSLLVHMAAGRPFLGLTPPRPLRVFYLQAEIQYHYLRERLEQIRLDPEVLAAARDTFVATPQLKLLLDAEGAALAADAVRRAFPADPVDILCIDPIRNVFDGGPDGAGENDTNAMMFFLKDRVEALREAVNPDCGVILVHHTRKLGKHQLKDDPFLALSGASALRGFYSAGLLMHRPDEERTERRLEIELRNGPALPAKLIDRVAGRWVEIDPTHERLVRQETGAKHDAERVRKNEVICEILYNEAAAGRMYTMAQFAEAFENQAGLGGLTVIRDRLSVLATKGYVKFLRGAGAAEIGLAAERSKYGYLCVEDMDLLQDGDAVDPETGEVVPARAAVRPSHYKCPRTGAVLPVENPDIWVYQAEEPA